MIFPHYKQHDIMDCGPTCLKIISKFFRKNIPLDYIRNISHKSRLGVSLEAVAQAAQTLGFDTLIVRFEFHSLKDDIPLPCVVYWRNRHYIVVYKITKIHVYVSDPAFGLIKYTHDNFIKGWLNKENYNIADLGYILCVETTPTFYSLDEETLNKNEYKITSFIFSFIKPYNKYWIQVFLGLLIISFLQLIFPTINQNIFDNGVNVGDLSLIYLLLIAYITLFVAQVILTTIKDWLILHISGRINTKITSFFLLKLLKMPVSFFDAKSMGDISQRLQDHQKLQSVLSTTGLNVLFSISNIIIFSIILFSWNVQIFLIFFIGSLFYVLWSLSFNKRRAELDYKKFDYSASNQNEIIQIISGLQDIKINNSENKHRWKWEKNQIKLFNTSLKYQSVVHLQNYGSNVINEMKNIFITFYSAKAAIEGDMSIGELIGLQYIIGHLAIPLFDIIVFSQSYQELKLALNRIIEVHNTNDEFLTTNDSNSSINLKDKIIFENVSFKYDLTSSKNIIDNLCINIPRGKVTAIVGESGSGKTTLLKLLLKFYEPTGGKIFIDNMDLKNYNNNEWRKNIGAVMQDGFIFSDSIKNNIAESENAFYVDEDKIDLSLEIAHLKEFVHKLPEKTNTKIGGSGVGMSGGQKQRLLIARAVYKNPQILLLDEATSALDANTERIIKDNFDEFSKNKTVIIIAHRLSTVVNADNILVLKDGKLIEEGNHESLIGNRSYYYSLIKDQLQLGE